MIARFSLMNICGRESGGKKIILTAIIRGILFRVRPIIFRSEESDMEKLTFAQAERAAQILIGGGVVAFPTETVYGLGVRFDRFESFERLNRVKNRPANKVYTMMLSDPRKISDYAAVTPRQQALIDRFMPGEVTFIFNRKDSVPDYAVAGGKTIGIRIPAHKELLNLLSLTGIPLLVPSANKSGEKPCKDFSEIQRVFGDEIDAAIDGPVGDSLPSSVVSLVGEAPIMIRRGKITENEIKEAWDSFKSL